MTQLAFDLEGVAPRIGPCIDGRFIHLLAPCGHCNRCGKSLLSIMAELAKHCPGHAPEPDDREGER